jgi:hypothetical protein
VLHRVFEFKDEIASDSSNTNFFCSEDFILPTDLFGRLFENLINNLNKSMQGPQINNLTQND